MYEQMRVFVCLCVCVCVCVCVCDISTEELIRMIEAGEMSMDGLVRRYV